MRTSIFVAALLLSTVGAASANATPALKRQLDRHKRYFARAHAAVVGGAVRPQASSLSVGVGVSALLGASASVGGAVVTDRGMKQKYLIAGAGLSAGIDLGAGPGALRTTKFGQRGTSGRDLISGVETRNTGRLPLERGSTSSNQGQVGEASGISTGIGIRKEKVAGFAIKIGAAKKSAMLRDVEEGVALSAQAQDALARGDTTSAQTALARMKSLRQHVRDDKLRINYRYRGIRDNNF